MSSQRGVSAVWRWLTRAGLLALVAAPAFFTGCAEKTPPRARRTTDQSTAEQDHLALAMQALSRFHEAGGSESRRQLLYQLNRWIGTQPADDAWERDPRVERLPRRFREMPEMTTLDERVFAPDDAQYLIEAYWLRAIARWVSQDATERWIAAQRAAADTPAYVDPVLDSPEYRLEMARSLFDWTVRHIQLDELLPYPTTAAATGPGGESASQSLTPPEQAIPGPGYRLFPYQVLLYGHGDAWQRSRLFALLARQLGLDVVMLAVDDRGPGSRANIWCPAVLIDDQLYLFDAALGLPIPGEKDGSVATLAEVRKNPELLRQLDVDDDGKTLKYPVAAEQLRSVAALVDATGEALSRRMYLLESRLSGDDALTLAVSPSEIAKQIHACPGLENVSIRIWTLPFETRMYRNALERLSRRDPEIQRRLYQEQGLYLPAIMQARHLHFLGHIAQHDDKPGAIAYYMESRKADDWIAEIQTSEEARQRIGMPPLPPNLTPQQRQNVLMNAVAQYQLNKQHAGYWIGLAQYDLGNYEAAVNWLKDRTLEAYPEGIWAPGARYNLARTYEQLGRIDESRKLYFQSESVQRHGNLLRARMLRGK